MAPPNGSTLCPQLLLIAAGIALAAAMAAPAAGQKGDRNSLDQSSPPAEWQIPPAPVREPEESMAMFDLPRGFRVELVAAEPLVQDPISFAFDDRGRLWVLEWPSYNWPVRDILPDLAPEEPPASRMVILEDTNGDGRMDHREVFMEIDWPRGLQHVLDGALIFALPDIVFVRDGTGDGRADASEVLYADLEVPTNPHAAPSSPLRGMDNWIYSLRMEERLRRVDGEWISQPSARLGGQWGMHQDNYGRFYFSYNQDHLRGSLFSPHYAARNPNYSEASGADVRIGRDQTTWPHGITAGVNRRGQLREDGTLKIFSANVGPSIYRGGHFPPEFVGNAFAAEAVGRLIRRSIITETDGILEGTNAYSQREFLFSHDERFRPVFTATGPDGALYIADMYRGIIEGHLFVTTYLRDQVIERDLHRPFNGMGRIYRIVHTDRALDEAPRLERHDLHGWINQLGHPNGFWRDTAQRLLVEAGDLAAVESLRDLAMRSGNELERLHALWTLEGLGQIDEDVVLAAAGAGSFRIRLAALRVAEPLLEVSTVREAVLALADDSRIEVRRQLLFTLGETTGEDSERVMARVLREDLEAPHMAAAALSGLRGREAAFLALLSLDPSLKDDSPSARELFAVLAAAVLNGGDVDDIEGLLARMNDDGEPLWRRRAILGGMAAAERRAFARVPANLHFLNEITDPEMREAAQKMSGFFAEAGRPAPADGADLSPSAQALRQEGESLYPICAACHQQDGRGRAGMAPALAGSPLVLGPSDGPIRIVLHGFEDDPDFPEMPPLTGLSDEQIAAVLTYIRTAWGNSAEPVAPEKVQEVRRAAEGRGSPWSREDLGTAEGAKGEDSFK